MKVFIELHNIEGRVKLVDAQAIECVLECGTGTAPRYSTVRTYSGLELEVREEPSRIIELLEEAAKA